MRSKKLKRIKKHTDVELDAAVNQAVAEFGERFWVLLHGIDAYMERRERKVQRLHDEMTVALDDSWETGE